jgi:hypothetical protein
MASRFLEEKHVMDSRKRQTADLTLILVALFNVLGQIIVHVIDKLMWP